jgi:hypothetical protein
MGDGNEGLSIAPSTMGLLAERGLILDLDIYDVGKGGTE